MKSYARPLVLLFSALGLIASVAALYVHYQFLGNPTYTSFCDVSETVSCQAVLQSEYGSLFGVPVAAGGAIWSALVFLLALQGMGSHESKDAGDVAGYIFVLSTIGLAATMYLGYVSFFVLRTACPLCLMMYVSVIGTFLVSAVRAPSLGGLPSRVGGDLGGLFKNPLAATLALAWLVGSVSLVAFFPRTTTPSAVVDAVEAAVVTERLEGDQLEQFHQWIDAQPRISLNVPTSGARVVIVKFNDYQCPACRQTYLEYKGIIARYQKAYPGQVTLINKDFPLDGECNQGTVHPAACEAAAAVRMAKATNRAEALEEWLFANQESMTPDSVKAAARDVGQVPDFDAQYPTILKEVSADATMGRELEVNATPTFFINGVRVQGGLRPMYFDAMLAYELKRTQ
jgi:uncharacterized membrane protein/protein-disulfide isomerase